MSVVETSNYLNLGLEDCEFKIQLKKKETLSDIIKEKILKLYPEYSFIYGPYEDDIYQSGKYGILELIYLYNKRSYVNNEYIRIPLIIALKEIEIQRKLTQNEIDKILPLRKQEFIVTNSNAKEELIKLIDTKKLIELNPKFEGFKNLWIGISTTKCDICVSAKIGKDNPRKSLLAILIEQELTDGNNYNEINVTNEVQKKLNSILGCNYYSAKLDDYRPYVLSNGQIATPNDFRKQLHYIDFKVIEKLYPEYYITDEFIIDNGRPSIKLKRKDTGKRRSYSFIKAIAESRLGRLLTDDESTDHLDRDLFNNDPSNLKVINRSEHASLDNVRVHIDDINCPNCGVLFSPKKWSGNNEFIDRAGPFCSFSCSSKYQHKVRRGEIKKETRNINKEYYRIDKLAANIN